LLTSDRSLGILSFSSELWNPLASIDRKRSLTYRQSTLPSDVPRHEERRGSVWFMAKQTILFDLDGTLTDSKPGITRCVQHALAEMGVIVDDLDVLTPFVGPPLRESFARYYGFDDEQSQRAIACYRERFARVGLFENAVYPGVPELLDSLQGAGMTLAIASAKPAPFVEQILEHFALRSYFMVVAGASLDHTRATKDAVIAHALQELGPDPAHRLIMVGDREHDILGARSHGIETVAVGYGYGTREELTAAAPLSIVDSVPELGEWLLAGTAAWPSHHAETRA
jgi:phosphoglycolate phosphatase